MSLSPEFALIERHFRDLGAARDDVALGIGDDCALLSPPPGQQLALSMDLLLAGRHFPLDTTPEAIGHKALAVNLSDLAAMGATPAWVTLGISLPEIDNAWLEGFARGFSRLARKHDVALIGGDTVRGPLSLALQIHGFIPEGAALTRGGASPGDLIYVSGTPGEAAAALPHRLNPGCHRNKHVAELIARLEYPTPRVALGMALRGLATASIDISDGLAGDLSHILSASKCGATLVLEQLPVSPALAAELDETTAQQAILHGGDDYELCFCAPAEHKQVIMELAKSLQLPLTCIGVIEAEPGLRLARADGTLLIDNGGGFDHFIQA